MNISGPGVISIPPTTFHSREKPPKTLKNIIVFIVGSLTSLVNGRFVKFCACIRCICRIEGMATCPPPSVEWSKQTLQTFEDTNSSDFGAYKVTTLGKTPTHLIIMDKSYPKFLSNSKFRAPSKRE